MSPPHREDFYRIFYRTIDDETLGVGISSHDDEAFALLNGIKTAETILTSMVHI